MFQYSENWEQRAKIEKHRRKNQTPHGENRYDAAKGKSISKKGFYQVTKTYYKNKVSQNIKCFT